MKLNAPVKGIFFDAGWTLLYPATADWFINLKLTDCIDGDIYAAIPESRKAAAFGHAQAFLDANHLVLTEEDELKQFETFYSMLADDLPELALTEQQIRDIAYTKIYDMDNYIYYGDTVGTLDVLKGRYKLGVISDTWPSIERILKHGGVWDHFETRTFSCFLGVFKPDRRMFLDALEQMKLPPEQTVFIDDTETNLDGAASCGIQPVLITANPKGTNSGRYPSIGRLSDLMDMLPD